MEFLPKCPLHGQTGGKRKGSQAKHKNKISVVKWGARRHYMNGNTSSSVPTTQKQPRTLVHRHTLALITDAVYTAPPVQDLNYAAVRFPINTARAGL